MELPEYQKLAYGLARASSWSPKVQMWEGDQVMSNVSNSGA